jgi:hypothetical protein
MTPTELTTLVIEARTAFEASAEAARQVREDPTRRLRTVTRVRPYINGNGNAWPDHWAVEVAYTPLEPGLGL